MITEATKITKDQYNKGYIAVDRITADNYFINEDDGICVWVGIREETLMHCTNDLPLELRDEYINEQIFSIKRECYIVNTSDCIDELDLDELSKGKILWI